MPKKEHVHKLRRHKYSNGAKVYFCVLNCDYKIEAALAFGKRSICHICGDEFTMNEYSLKLAKPHCINCGKMQVTDEEGKRRFISKNRPQAAMADLAKDSVRSLKDRLAKVVTMERDPRDEDI